MQSILVESRATARLYVQHRVISSIAIKAVWAYMSIKCNISFSGGFLLRGHKITEPIKPVLARRESVYQVPVRTRAGCCIKESCLHINFPFEALATYALCGPTTRNQQVNFHPSPPSPPISLTYRNPANHPLPSPHSMQKPLTRAPRHPTLSCPTAASRPPGL